MVIWLISNVMLLLWSGMAAKAGCLIVTMHLCGMVCLLLGVVGAQVGWDVRHSELQLCCL